MHSNLFFKEQFCLKWFALKVTSLWSNESTSWISLMQLHCTELIKPLKMHDREKRVLVGPFLCCHL